MFLISDRMKRQDMSLGKEYPKGCAAVIDTSDYELPYEGRFGRTRRFKIVSEATCDAGSLKSKADYYEGLFNVVFDPAAKDIARGELEQEVSELLFEMCLTCPGRRRDPPIQ